MSQGISFLRQIEIGVLDGHTGHHGGRPEVDLSPKFQLSVFLEGQQQFAIDEVNFDVSAGYAPHCEPRALALSRTRDCTLRLVHRPGERLRKVMISAPISWLEDMALGQEDRSPELINFVSGHLNHFYWTLSKHAIKLAEEIAQPSPALHGEARDLFRQAKALELMSLACMTLVERDKEQVAKSNLSALRQSEKVRDYLLEHLDEALTIDRIARETGASVSTVQRHFKEHFGTTVFDFIRLRRLERAREFLERQGATVAQAAYIAGYASPTNFTTAFKKTFGVAPKYHRA